MFTDQPVTPMRVEVLVDFFSHNTSSKISRKMLYELLQPEAIIKEDAARTQAKATISAALELELIQEESGVIKPKFSKEKKSTRQRVFEAIDRRVLSETTVEPYFAPFYSYLLYLNENGAIDRAGQDWAIEFNRDVHQGRKTRNPFNSDKVSGLNRWLTYCGLGWFDPAGVFQPNPYQRLRRALPMIFEGKTKVLSGEEFMARLASACPELDGGAIYSATTQNLPAEQGRCTLGLSHALLDLHIDQAIKLNCPADARGWDISRARPRHEGSIQSSFIASVELL